LNEAKTLAARV
jgi:hypothetical protein